MMMIVVVEGEVLVLGGELESVYTVFWLAIMTVWLMIPRKPINVVYIAIGNMYMYIMDLLVKLGSGQGDREHFERLRRRAARRRGEARTI